MTKAAKALLELAKTLAPEERAMLAEQLLETLDPDSDAEIEAAWAAEVASRAEEAERDPSVLVPWTEVRDEILREFRKK